MLAGHGGGFGTAGHKRINGDVPLMRADAPKVTCDVLCMMNPGDHGQNLDQALNDWARFFADHLV